jgi:sugar phosphate isomerase/epimerase
MPLVKPNTSPPSDFSRRSFMATLAAAALAPRPNFAAESKPAERFPLITFSKPFQDVGFERTADIVAEVGWSGIECPVRAKGQVLPERVEDDLPKLHEALTKRGLTLTLITTDIGRPDPLAERVLRTAAKLGVKRFRTTFFKYDLNKPIPPQWAEVKAGLRDLIPLCKELGMKAGFQNHSGKDMIGAPIWDIYELVHDLDPEHIGTCFDIGHATLEGGTSWPIEAKLMEPFLTCVYVKDFYWEKGPKGWAAKWGPLGEGMVRKEFFDWLKKSAYTGPISQHCEYLHGDGPEQMAAMKKDCALLKQWLGQA